MLRHLVLIGFILSWVPLSAIDGSAVDIPVSGGITGQGCFLSPQGEPRCFTNATTITGPDFILTGGGSSLAPGVLAPGPLFVLPSVNPLISLGGGMSVAGNATLTYQGMRYLPADFQAAEGFFW